jgi:two-component system response regulator DevR
MSTSNVPRSRTPRRGQTAPLSVVLIDAFPTVRAGLALLISREPDLELAGETGTPKEALALIRKVRRRNLVVVVGLNLQDEDSSFALIRGIRAEFPSVPILASSAGSDPMAVARAMFYGADGFVEKMVEPEVYLTAIRSAGSGEVVLEGLPQDWLQPISEGIGRQLESGAVLTDRERRVLAVSVDGLTAREIGTRLGISERTVTTHLSNIYRKLGTSGRVGAVTVAARSGLISVTGQERRSPARPRFDVQVADHGPVGHVPVAGAVRAKTSPALSA